MYPIHIYKKIALPLHNSYIGSELSSPWDYLKKTMTKSLWGSYSARHATGGEFLYTHDVQ